MLSGASATARSRSASPSADRALAFIDGAAPEGLAGEETAVPSPRHTSASAWLGSAASVSAISFIARSKAVVSPSMPANMSSRTLKSKRCWARTARLIMRAPARGGRAGAWLEPATTAMRRARSSRFASQPADAGDEAADRARQANPEQLGSQGRQDSEQDTQRIAHGKDRDAEAEREPAAGDLQPAVLGPQAHRALPARWHSPAAAPRAAPQPSRRRRGRAASIVRCRRATCRR